MKKLNKVNEKRNDTVVAYGCKYNCKATTVAVYKCDRNGAHLTGYAYTNNQVNNYVYHK